MRHTRQTKRTSYQNAVAWLIASALLLGGWVFPTRTARAQGQTTGKGVGRDGAGVTQLPAKEKRYALIIGVDNYDDANISALRGASNDAKALARALRDYAGFDESNIVLLTSDAPRERQPTRDNILLRLSNLRAVVPKDGLLLISFSGHGIERDGQAYLLPSGAKSNGDTELLEDTALGVERMKRSIKAIGVQQVVILLDACRNDPTSGKSDTPNPLTTSYTRGFSFDVRNREVEAFATIYATSVGARAYEYAEKQQGYFSWAVVEALSGKAANAQGEVTLGSLVKYLQERVPKQVQLDLGAKVQKPFAVVEGYSANELVLGVSFRKPLSIGEKSEEVAFWQAIENSTVIEDFENYLTRCRKGEFTGIYKAAAALKIKQLTEAARKSGVVSWSEMPLIKGKIISKPDTTVFGEHYPDSIYLPDEIVGFRTAKKYNKLIMKVGIQDNANARGNKPFRIMNENGILYEGNAIPNRRPILVELDISDSDVIGFANDYINGEPREFVRYMDVTFVVNPNPTPALTKQRVIDVKGVNWADMPLVKGKVFQKVDTVVFGEKYPNSIYLSEEQATFRTAKKYKKLIMMVGVQDNRDARGQKHFWVKDDNGTLHEGEVRPNRRPILIEVDISESDLIGFSNYDINGEPTEFVRYINVTFVPK